MRQGIAAFLLAAAAPFLPLFAASLAALAGASAFTSRELWRRILLRGSIIVGAVTMVMALIHFALANGADDVAPAALQALNLLDGNFWVAANPSLGAMMLGAAGWLIGRVGIYNWLGFISSCRPLCRPPTQQGLAQHETPLLQQGFHGCARQDSNLRPAD